MIHGLDTGFLGNDDKRGGLRDTEIRERGKMHEICIAYGRGHILWKNWNLKVEVVEG